MPEVLDPVVVPYTEVPKFSVTVAAQVPVNAFKSSPLIVAVMVNEKFTVGVVILVARVIW